MRPLVFFGATAFREHAQIVRDINKQTPTYSIDAILDDNPCLHGTRIDGVQVVGPLDEHVEFPDAQFVFGIGSVEARLARYGILERLAIPSERYATLIHPTATIYSSASIGHGCIIFPGAVVSCDTTVAEWAQLLTNSNVGVSNYVCEGALVAALVATTADVLLGPFSHVGAGSCVAPSVMIGAGAQIGMGSVVLRDVPNGAFVLGNPATVVRRDDVEPDVVRIWEGVLHGNGKARGH